MASVILKGSSLQPYLQEQSYDFDPSRGYVYHARFRGASQADMNILYETYANAGIACRYTLNQGDSSTLEIEDSTQANSIDNWQFVGNEEARDIWSHPLALNLFNTDQAAAIRYHLANNDSQTVAFGSPPPNVADLSGFASNTNATTPYNLALRGATDYRRGQYVLRHTTNISNRSTVNIADFGVDAIYSPAKLLSEIGNSSLWVFPAPNRLLYKISQIPTQSVSGYYFWGWLKGASTETTIAHNRVEIQQDYTLDLWSTWDYAVY